MSLLLNHDYLVTKSTSAITKQNKPYVNLTIKDESSTYSVSVWGLSECKLYSIVTFTKIKESDSFLSCAASDVILTKPTASHPLSSLIPRVTSKKDFYSCGQYLASLMSESEAVIWSSAYTKMYDVYLPYPAGKTNHQPWPGGLVDHTYHILHMFELMYPALPFKVNPFVVAMSALFHDAYKIYCYAPGTFDYTMQGALINHVAGSYLMVTDFLRAKNVDSSTTLQIQHCVLAHHEMLEYGSPVKPSTVEAELLAMLDRISGHGGQIAETATPDGVRVPNLSTTVYSFDKL